MAHNSSQLTQRFSTPVLFLIFNRPDTTKRVFEAIRGARPTRLFVACDGARPRQAGEKELVEEARRVATRVDWDCEVKVLFRKKNLGCGLAISSAIDWFFEHVEEGIILEDDCVPEYTFFRFCAEMLEKYRQERQVMLISGALPGHFKFRPTRYSYFFARESLCWGWATWKRAWQYYHATVKIWPKIRDRGWMYKLCHKWIKREYIKKLIENVDLVYTGKVDAWGELWSLAIWLQSGMEILSRGNLIVNIGFDDRATHTKNVKSWANLRTTPMKFPLKHPPRKPRDSNTIKRRKAVYRKLGLQDLIRP